MHPALSMCHVTGRCSDQRVFRVSDAEALACTGMQRVTHPAWIRPREPRGALLIGGGIWLSGSDAAFQARKPQVPSGTSATAETY